MSEEILKKLDEANDKLDLLLQWRAGLEERCKAHLEKTEEVRTVLFENPHGLVCRVDKLTQCKKSITEWREFWIYILKVVLAAAIISLAGWLFFVYSEHNVNKQTNVANDNN